MSEPPAHTDQTNEAGSTSNPTDGTSSEPEVRSAIEAARALADSEILKARNHRKNASLKDRWIFGPLLSISGLATYIALRAWVELQDADNNIPPPFSFWWVIGWLGLFFLFIAVTSVRASGRKDAFEEVVRAEELKVRLAELDYIPETDGPLTANRALLQEYHRLSTNQARAAFRLAAWVMSAAAVLVFAGGVSVILAHDSTTAVTLASLTAFISALSGYVSSTLLTTYRISVEQARFYFREPLAGGYLLAAEHLAKRLDPPEHTAALGRVVDGFIQAAVNVPEPAVQDPQPEPRSDSPGAA